MATLAEVLITAGLAVVVGVSLGFGIAGLAYDKEVKRLTAENDGLRRALKKLIWEAKG